VSSFIICDLRQILWEWWNQGHRDGRSM
jgi:hypothetical protein